MAPAAQLSGTSNDLPHGAMFDNIWYKVVFGSLRKNTLSCQPKKESTKYYRQLDLDGSFLVWENIQHIRVRKIKDRWLSQQSL